MTLHIGDEINLTWKDSTGAYQESLVRILAPGRPGAPYDFYCRGGASGIYPIGAFWDDEDECYKGVEL